MIHFKRSPQNDASFARKTDQNVSTNVSHELSLIMIRVPRKPQHKITIRRSAMIDWLDSHKVREQHNLVCSTTISNGTTFICHGTHQHFRCCLLTIFSLSDISWHGSLQLVWFSIVSPNCRHDVMDVSPRPHIAVFSHSYHVWMLEWYKSILQYDSNSGAFSSLNGQLTLFFSAWGPRFPNMTCIWVGLPGSTLTARIGSLEYTLGSFIFCSLDPSFRSRGWEPRSMILLWPQVLRDQCLDAFASIMTLFIPTPSYK